MRKNERLERLVADEVVDCSEGDIEQRVTWLKELQRDVEERTSPLEPRLFSKLGDETRYTIMRVLHAADKELCSCEIEGFLDVSESAQSHAISDLVDVGLVERQKEGKWRYYTVTERAEALLDALDTTDL
jgi:DNA-binding transcriptional ArsR family regulator